MSATWREPESERRAGWGKWKRPPSAYDMFMESEGVPSGMDDVFYTRPESGVAQVKVR